MDNLSRVNGSSLLRIQGPKVNSSRRMISGPRIVETRVVIHGDLLNHPSSHPCWVSFSRYHRLSLSLSLAMEFLMTPEWLT